ncbi:hypothetical protein FACS1894137_11350 [Spirochaetia bacterium]|nr:hypothetical protein FACS1894137_11350 [Spirochaetia bacterium]
MLIPVDMREWVPENHLVHFIIDAIGQLDISSFKVNRRGSGDEQYPPEMMLARLGGWKGYSSQRSPGHYAP